MVWISLGRLAQQRPVKLPFSWNPAHIIGLRFSLVTLAHFNLQNVVHICLIFFIGSLPSSSSVMGADQRCYRLPPDLNPKLWSATGLRPSPRVKKNWPEPVQKPRLLVKPIRTGSGLGRFQTGPNLKFKFEFKKMKNSQKNSKNTSSCDKSNGVNFFQIFVHLVYFASIWS